MAQKALMSAGVLVIRTGPNRLVASVRTFRHPSGVEVTIHPLTSIASVEYLSTHWYDLHSRYDAVLLEEGNWISMPNSFVAQLGKLAKVIFPYKAYGPWVDQQFHDKYEVSSQLRDPLDSRIAFESVLHNKQPPVDPRAHRGVQRLNLFALNSANEKKRVVMPWHVYHAAYLYQKLPAEGYEMVKSEEVTVITQLDTFKIGVAGSCIALLGGALFFKKLFEIIFSW